jgi:hypothetical protein
MLRGCIALALVAAVAGSAQGKPERRPPPPDPAVRVALVQLRLSGDAPAELRPQLEQSISRGLAGVQLVAVPTAEVRAALEGTPLLDCTSVTCLQEMAEKLAAARFLRATLETSGENYGVELELMDSAGGSARRSGRCDVCTLVELNELVEKLAGELITAPDAPPIEVLIVSRPEHAILEIDGKPVGAAPFTGKLAPGAHTVRALLTGHREAERTIEVRPGESQQRFEIILEQPVDKPPPPQERPFRTWKWVAAGGAGVALLGGIVLIAMDGKQTCDKQPGQLECPERLNTLPGGLATVGVGVAAGAASAWMFLRDGRDREAAATSRGPQPRISFTQGGAIAAVRWRF